METSRRPQSDSPATFGELTLDGWQAAASSSAPGPLFPAVSWSLPGEWPARAAAAPGDPTLALPGPCRALPPEPPPDLLAGWGRFCELELVGVGGMGRVYRAVDPRNGRAVAVKFLLDARDTADPLREARLQARVAHRGVLPVLDHGELGPYGWLSMPFVEGCTIKSAARGLPLAATLTLMARVARTAAAVHRAGVVHLDVNPRNVLVASGAGGHRSWLIDFGIAQELCAPRPADPGRVVGTPAYMAPEQALGRNHLLDPRTDVYGLGATLYELASGRRPFAAETSEAVLTKAIHDTPVPLHDLTPGVPPELEELVSRCLEKDPADRYASADELAAELEAVAAAS